MRQPSSVALAIAALIPFLLGITSSVGTNTLPKDWDTWLPWVAWPLTILLVIALVILQIRSPRPPPPPVQTVLNNATQDLASSVREQWREEEERRRIQVPIPLPVRWRSAPRVDSWENIQGSPAGTRADPLNLGGTFGDLAGIYTSVPSRRLVILGGAGSGKTILAIHLLLDLLERRTSDASPVPVLLSLGRWDPTEMPIRTWLVNQLSIEYGWLNAISPMSDGSIASALVNAGRILPVLDGFDEIAPALRRRALRELNDTTMPFVMTSRSREYYAAAKFDGVLTRAAGISINDLNLNDLRGYLPRTVRSGQPNRRTEAWDPVLSAIESSPTSRAAKNIRRLFSTPLMVSLARIVYSDDPNRSPEELLDPVTFPTVRTLRDHLLLQFVNSMYQHPQPARQVWPLLPRLKAKVAEKYLGRLAADLRASDDNDISWWKLHRALPSSIRVLTYASAGGVGLGVPAGQLWPLGTGVGVVFGLGLGLASHDPMIVRTPTTIRGRESRVLLLIATGVVNGIVGGVIGGLLSPRVGLSDFVARGLDQGISPAIGLAIGGAVGLVFAALHVFLGRQPAVVPDPASSSLSQLMLVAGYTFFNGAVGGLALGLSGGLALGITSGFVLSLLIALDDVNVEVAAVPSPLDLLTLNRRNSVTKMAIFFLAVAIPVSLSNSVQLGVGAGLAVALAFGFGLTPWGQWIILSRFGLPLTGHSPFKLPGFLLDAHRRGVFRQAGGVYQFRHVRLRDRLASIEGIN